MKTGIIIFSNTGNTHSVAKKIEEKLQERGKDVEYHRLEISGGYNPNKDNGKKDFNFEYDPYLDSYDTIFFGAPVMAFGLCPPMKSYLKKIKDVKGKKIVLLTTEYFPYPWMGGNRAIRQMKKLVKAKGGKVVGSGVVNWSRKTRKKIIKDVVSKVSVLIK